MTMPSFRAALMAAALAAAGPALGEQPAPVLEVAPQAQSFQLANGLEVVVVPDHRAPVVTHMVWYKVGSADEPAGKSGIAHFLEHLMFKGTKTNPGASFSRQVAEIGGQENAFTSYDYTAYFQRVAREHLGLVMTLEADRMEGLVLDEPTAAPELKVVLEERSQRTDNNPSALFNEAMDAAMYASSPYRLPVIGWRHEVEKLTAADAIRFYNQWYTPNNAVLVVAGDVTMDDVRALAEKTYGKVVRRAEVAERSRPTEPPPLAQRRVTYKDERVTQPSLMIAWLAPSQRTAGAGESEAIDLLCEAIGGGSTSRLYKALVIDKPLASNIGCSYRQAAYDDTVISIYGTPADGVTLDALRQAVEAQVAEITGSGLADDELQRARHRMLASAIHAQDSQQALARIVGAGRALGEPLASIKSWPSRIEAVDSASVKAAAGYFRPERMVVGYLESGPPTGRARAGRAAAMPGPSGDAIRHGEAAPAQPFAAGDQ